MELCAKWGLTGGVGFEFAYRLPFVPMLLGFDGELWQHSTDARALNSDLAGHLLVRIQRSTGSFRPDADAVIGLDYIATYVQGVETPVLETRVRGQVCKRIDRRIRALELGGLAACERCVTAKRQQSWDELQT